MSVKAIALVWDLLCGQKLNEIEFKPGHKFCLIAYADHADHDGKNIYPAVMTISKKTGFDERSVQRLTRDNENMGLLVADGKGPRGTNKWYIPFSSGGDKIAPLTILQGDKNSESLGDKNSESLGDKLPPEPLTLTNDIYQDPEIKKQNLAYFRNSAIGVFGNDILAWRKIEKILVAPNVAIIHTDHTFTVSGLGMQAAFYQDHYARSFERAMVGVLNVEVKINFEE